MPFLMVDTSLFADSDFQDRLLATLPDIEGQMDGLLVNSENFQAISFLTNSYSRSVDAFYLDPPYNTPFSEIPYKNDFKHSCWISMMHRQPINCSLLMKMSDARFSCSRLSWFIFS